MEFAFSSPLAIAGMSNRHGRRCRRAPGMNGGAEHASTTLITNSEERRGPVPAAFGEGIEGARRRENVARSAKTRVRQHLNPLAARWQGPVTVNREWYDMAYSDANQALLVDIGCGKGRFAEKMAMQDKTCNILALEIRAPLVEEAKQRAERIGLKNVAYLACNANVSLRSILSCAPSGKLREITIQFSDPWFKKKHEKRRLVDRALVSAMHDTLRASHVAQNGHRTVFIQTDVHSLAVQMRSIFDSHRGLRRDHSHAWTADGWLAENAYAVKTEREMCVERKKGQVYRALFTLAAEGWDRDGVWDAVDEAYSTDESEGTEIISEE